MLRLQGLMMITKYDIASKLYQIFGNTRRWFKNDCISNSKADKFYGQLLKKIVVSPEMLGSFTNDLFFNSKCGSKVWSHEKFKAEDLPN